MNLYVVGTGYVGLVTGTCFAAKGHHVTCIDVDAAKISRLHEGILPIYEPGLDDLVARTVATGALKFSTSLADLLKNEPTPDAIFIAVGTPSGEDGSADLQYVLAVAREIGANLRERCVIVDKSTVPVGTAGRVSAAIGQELAARGLDIEFEVVSNPEFLKEGAAVKDFMDPDRVVVGAESEHARDVMSRIYLPLLAHGDAPLQFMRVKDAEMTKYAANAMLALRITFMNELSVLCDALDVDIDQVRQGIGTDRRIGPHALFAGCGFGGSCFPKDVRALIHTGDTAGVELGLLKQVEERNAQQKRYLVEKVVKHYACDDLSGKTVALWGLAFKAGTDDMRQAPALDVIAGLVQRGARVRAHDPVAMQAALVALSQAGIDQGAVTLVETPESALEGADALVLATDWAEFKAVRPEAFDVLRDAVVFDGRNALDSDALKARGLAYYGIGRR